MTTVDDGKFCRSGHHSLVERRLGDLSVATTIDATIG
jgi:hypothetical protein